MGGRSSNSNASSANTSYDNRQVYDAGGGIAGSGNLWDQSTNWNQSQEWAQTTNNTDNRTTQDSGNVSWAQTTNNTDNRTTRDSGNTSWNQTDSGNTSWTSDSRDSSNRSTNNSGNSTWTSDSRDSSNRSQTWTQNTVDGGAIKGMSDIGLAQADLAAKIAQIASTNATKAADTAASAAIRAQENALSTAGDSMRRALDFAQSSGAQAHKSNAEGLGMVYDGFAKLASMTGQLVGGAQKQADSAASSVQAAYTSAASQANGNKTLTIAALAVVGVIAAAVVIRRQAA